MSCAEACWRKIGVRFHVTVVTKNVLSKFIPKRYRPAHTKSVILEQKSMARSRMGQILLEASRVYVEERLFRAASAFAFDQWRVPERDRFCPKAAASRWKSSSLERTWKSGSLEPRQHLPLIGGFSPGQP